MAGMRRHGRAALAILPLGLVLVGIAPAQARSAAPAPPFRPPLLTSFHPSTVGLRTAAVTPRAAATLPASVDLTAATLPAGNQGAVSSCTSWAVGYSLLGHYSRTQPHAGAPFAPMYVYSQINGGRDNGSAVGDALDLVVAQGIAERAVYPQGDNDWRTRPTAAERANAAGHKVASWANLFVNGRGAGAAGVTAIKAALATGHPVVLVMKVYQYPFYSGWWDQPRMPVQTLANTSGAMIGYHAVTAFGYDQAGLVLENSWSTRWGYRGFGELGWDFVAGNVLEADQIDGFAAADPAPTLTGLAPGSVTGLTGGQTLTLTGTNLARATAVTLTPVAGGAALTAVIRARTATTLTATLPRARTAGAYTVTVTTPSGTVPAPGTFGYLVTPALSTVSPSSVSGLAGGRAVTVSGRNLATVTALTLVPVAGGRAVPVAVLARADTALRATLPTVPVAGAYRVVAAIGSVTSAPAPSATVTYRPLPPARSR